MRTSYLAAAVAGAAALLGLGGTALALGTDHPVARPAAISAPAPTPSPAPATGRDRAEAVAVERAGGGHVVAVDHEVEHGRAEWKVVVLGPSGRSEVRVDDASGAVTRAPSTPGRSADDHGTDDHGTDDRGGRHGSDDGPGHR